MRATGNRGARSLGSSNPSLGAIRSFVDHNLHVWVAIANNVEEANTHRQRWLALVILGLILHVLAMSNSDLGLDAHVRLNVAMDEQHTGQDLAWGKLRVSESADQQPSSEHVYDGYVPPWIQSEWTVKITAFVGVIIVALMAGYTPKWRVNDRRFEPMWAALVILSPIFLFVSGRGYDEGVLACVVGAGVGGFFSTRAPCAMNGFFMLSSWQHRC